MKLYSIAKRFRVDNPKKFRLSDCDPAECYGLTVDKSEAKVMLAEGIERLSDLQDRLYASNRWSVLIVLQAMDAAGKDIWQERFHDIREFERHLARNGTLVLKFFLNVSKDEQRRRLLDRIEEPAKRWKFSMGDIAERKLWSKYMDAYEDMIRHTSTPEAPWFVVPADNKWFTRLVVAGAIVQELQALDLDFPRVEGKALKELAKTQAALKAEKP